MHRALQNTLTTLAICAISIGCHPTSEPTNQPSEEEAAVDNENDQPTTPEDATTPTPAEIEAALNMFCEVVTTTLAQADGRNIAEKGDRIQERLALEPEFDVLDYFLTSLPPGDTRDQYDRMVAASAAYDIEFSCLPVQAFLHRIHRFVSTGGEQDTLEVLSAMCAQAEAVLSDERIDVDSRLRAWGLATSPHMRASGMRFFNTLGHTPPEERYDAILRAATLANHNDFQCEPLRIIISHEPGFEERIERRQRERTAREIPEVRHEESTEDPDNVNTD